MQSGTFHASVHYLKIQTEPPLSVLCPLRLVNYFSRYVIFGYAMSANDPTICKAIKSRQIHLLVKRPASRNLLHVQKKKQVYHWGTIKNEQWS